MLKLIEVTKRNSGLNLIERKELQEMAADLGLKLVPEICRYERIPGVIACVHYQAFSVWKDINVRGRDYQQLICESSKPIYKINVDMGKLFARQKEIYKRFGAYAAYDYTAVLIMHELRHIWQAQEQFIRGYASSEHEWIMELDAIRYPVDVCTGRRRLLAYREQLIDEGKVDTREFCKLEKRIYRAYKGVR